MQLFELGDVRVSATGLDEVAGFLEIFVAADQVTELGGEPSSDELVKNKHVDLELNLDTAGLQLKWNRLAGDGRSLAALDYYIDVVKLVKQMRSFPAPKQGAFNQALGKKSRRILDATGGWGGDALLMCMQGYEVIVIERQPLMGLLLHDAMQRLAKTDWALSNDVVVPKVIRADSIGILKPLAGQVDCVYLDPMFPPKKKKSAAANKNMQLLHWLVGEDLDASALVAASLECGARRVAVKRPDYAEPLYRKPDAQFSSKLVHYDMYLSSE